MCCGLLHLPNEALGCVWSFLLVSGCLGLFLDVFGCFGSFLDRFVLSSCLGLSCIERELPVLSGCLKLVVGCFMFFWIVRSC